MQRRIYVYTFQEFVVQVVAMVLPGIPPSRFCDEHAFIVFIVFSQCEFIARDHCPGTVHVVAIKRKRKHQTHH